MFGLGKKGKKPDGQDMLVIKTEENKNRSIYLVSFPSHVANDVVSMLKKLQKSAFNKPEYLGEVGGFRLVTHLEGMTHYVVLDEGDMEGHPVHIQDFANILLLRLEGLAAVGKLPESEDFAFLMGELTMLRDGSFVPQN